MNSSMVTSANVSQEPPCWLQEPYVIIYMGIALSDFLLSLPSYGFLVVVLLRSKAGAVVSDIFLLNLAVVELIICLNTVLLGVEMLNFDPLLDLTVSFNYGFLIVARPLCQSCICVERYVAVVHPIKFLKYKTLRYKLPCLALVWLVITIIYIVNINRVTYNFILAVFIPNLAIDLFCSFSILRALRQSRPGDGEREEMNLMKKRAFTTVSVILMTLLFNYSPVVIVSALIPFFSLDYSECLIFSYAYCFTLFGNFVHSIMYLSRAGKLPCRQHV